MSRIKGMRFTLKADQLRTEIKELNDLLLGWILGINSFRFIHNSNSLQTVKNKKIILWVRNKVIL
jgi:hypothetical protein